MLIEKELIQFRAFQINPNANGFTLNFQQKTFQLSSLQATYLQVLQRDGSIENSVLSFLQQGWLVHFRELYNLIFFLVHQKIILNPSFQNYFFRIQNSNFKSTNFNSLPENTSSADIAETIQHLPFFRALTLQTRDLLLANSSYYKLASGTLITKYNDRSRDMFVLTKGVASIYKPEDNGSTKWMAHLSAGSVFGEGGFFLDQARSADIVADTPIELVRIRYQPQKMDSLIDKEKAAGLQVRFWVLHALNRSVLFKSIPADCMDALLHTGRTFQVQANQTLFQQDQIANSFFILIQGKINILQNGKLINQLGQGDSLGEVGLMLNSGKRSASAVVVESGLVLEIKAQDFYRSLGQNLFLAKELEQLAEDRLRLDQARR